MVYAGRPALSDNTFAARPVGASNTTLRATDERARTMAAVSVVLPVPADPRNNMTLIGLADATKAANTRSTSDCPRVGGKGKHLSISATNSSIALVVVVVAEYAEVHTAIGSMLYKVGQCAEIVVLAVLKHEHSTGLQ